MDVDSYDTHGYSALAKWHRTHQYIKHKELMDYIKEEAKDNEVIPIPWVLSTSELRCLELHYLDTKDNIVYLNVKALDHKRRNALTKAKKSVSNSDLELPWDQ
jgi:hypothetical protein